MEILSRQEVHAEHNMKRATLSALFSALLSALIMTSYDPNGRWRPM
jgi:hypothetical protein